MFGQRVKLEVFDNSKSNLVFSTETLRVDFDVRNEYGLNKAKFTIYNLNSETSANLTNGVRFVRLSVALHDQDWQILASNLFISNAYSETLLPNRLTYLYCFDAVTKENLENPVSATLSGNQTLKRLIDNAASSAGFTGSVTYPVFPAEVLNYKPPRTHAVTTQTTFKQFMKDLGKQFTFEFYVSESDIIVQYLPTATSLSRSTLDDSRRITVVLDSNNLRSNPKLGASTLQLVSNLDPSIVPSVILDVSNLITASADVSDDKLQTTKNLLKTAVSGFKKFICLQSRHVGSNYTKNWSTTATGTSPRRGTRMSTANWYN
jgi:hypothetical protein